MAASEIENLTIELIMLTLGTRLIENKAVRPEYDRMTASDGRSGLGKYPVRDDSAWT